MIHLRHTEFPKSFTHICPFCNTAELFNIKKLRSLKMQWDVNDAAAVKNSTPSTVGPSALIPGEEATGAAITKQ